MSFPVTELVKTYKPEWIFEGAVCFKRSVMQAIELDKLDQAVTQCSVPYDQVDQIEQVDQDYASGDESLYAPYLKALKDDPSMVVNVKTAKMPYTTGGYPAHCPVSTCRQRFPDVSKVYRHWRGKEHDGDREGREKKDIKGLLTDKDNCARSDDPTDETVCPTCVVADKIVEAKKEAGEKVRKRRKRPYEASGSDV